MTLNASMASVFTPAHLGAPCDAQPIQEATVRDRMSAPAIVVAHDDPASVVEHILLSHGISAVPVTEDGRLVGIVSMTDLLAQLPTDGERTPLVAQVMTSPVVVARPDEPLDQAAWRMVAGRVHRLVVVEDERVVGVLSVRDVLEEVVTRRLEAPIRSVMSAPVETVSSRDTLDEAIGRLADAGVHGLVVVDGRAPVGVFTQVEALAARRLPALHRPVLVEEGMSYDTVSLDADTPIHRAATEAVAANARRILVCEGGQLAGVLSCIDLVGVLARA